LILGIMLREAGLFELSEEGLALVGFAAVTLGVAVSRFRKPRD
jgi:hypothetical protein